MNDVSIVNLGSALRNGNELTVTLIDKGDMAPARESRAPKKVTKRPKRPRDPAQFAKFIVDTVTGEIERGTRPRR